ncbi:TetR family transcriptional regulator [Paenibacillus sp. BIC5C1]|uniref:TetR family transcriptional regulator n=1 Tax=Paenibacillus sp. BIC5C1 TaxID=3078263 RepID=UPI0028E6CE29|nr:TetR family transcriptional regulator [Paenibacillus sp. BIC5C1]
MGNKVRDMRTTQTKQSLINAFFYFVSVKDFEKITIADLTQEAKVNRATFYAHFKDKYDLLDYIMGDSAIMAIERRTLGVTKFNQESINQLILAVCDFYQQPKLKCRQSYIGLVIPQLKEKIIYELKQYLSKSTDHPFSDREKDLYIPIYAQIIHEAGYLWASENIEFSKEEVARKISKWI